MPPTGEAAAAERQAFCAEWDFSYGPVQWAYHVLSCLYFAKKETEIKYWSPDCLRDLTASLLAGPLGHPTSLSKAVLSHENTWLSGFYLAT